MNLAVDVLKQADKPLTYNEVWHDGVSLGLSKRIASTGKTPWNTLGAQLYVDVRDNPNSMFIKIGNRPTRFFLKARAKELPSEVNAQSEIEPAPSSKSKQPKYKERDLHPVLTYFAFATPSFNRGREIITKTIHHEKSKKGYADWTHPDMVGFSVPIEDWHPDVLAFNELLDQNALTLFSFELKRSIDRTNYRESFFQAVSNSSWAHQGFLVAAEIEEDDDLLSELERLASSFGIGIVRLNLEDVTASEVVYVSRQKSFLDWETINKLCEQNPDFRKFLQSVKIDVSSRKIHRSEYDAVVTEIDSYLACLIAGS
jgi:hypothetical protein